MTVPQTPAGVASMGIPAYYYGSRINTSDDMVGTGTPSIIGDTVTGSSFFVTGSDASYNFDATPPLLPAATLDCTFTCWINSSDVATAYRGAWQDGTSIQLLQSGGTIGNLTYVWEFTADEYNSDSGLSLTADRWYLAAFTIEATRAIVYAVSSQDGFRSWTNTKAHTAKTITTGLRIGTGTAAGWRGRIVDFRAYTRVLTANEIWQLFDPATRWELYQTCKPKMFMEAPASDPTTLDGGFQESLRKLSTQGSLLSAGGKILGIR